MKVHPAAAAYPMLPDDEVQALAADIGANGLIHPLVRWLDMTSGEWLLLDGRNRLAACELAGVKPSYVDHDGDPVVYVLSANSHRRHLSKGKLAMAGVLAVGNDSPPSSGRALATRIGCDHRLVDWARTVIEHAPSLVDAVLRPQQPMALKDAYDRAAKLREAAADPLARLAHLREADTDLAELVDAQQLDLADAEAAAQQRAKRTADERRDARALLVRSLDLIAPEQPSIGFVESWANHLGEVDGSLLMRLDAAIDVLSDLRKRVEP